MVWKIQGWIHGYPSSLQVGRGLEVTRKFGLEPWGQRPQRHKKCKVWLTGRQTDAETKRGIKSRARDQQENFENAKCQTEETTLCLCRKLEINLQRRKNKWWHDCERNDSQMTYEWQKNDRIMIETKIEIFFLPSMSLTMLELPHHWLRMTCSYLHSWRNEYKFDQVDSKKQVIIGRETENGSWPRTNEPVA